MKYSDYERELEAIEERINSILLHIVEDAGSINLDVSHPLGAIAITARKMLNASRELKTLQSQQFDKPISRYTETINKIKFNS